MPQVRKLSDVNPQTNPTGNVPPKSDPFGGSPQPTQPPNGNQSLSETNPQTVNSSPVNQGELATLASGVSLPAWLQRTTIAETIPTGGIGTYVGFAEPLSKNWPQYTAAGLSQGKPFVCVNGQFLKIEPFRYFLLDAKPYRLNMDATGKVLWVTDDLETPLDVIASRQPNVMNGVILNAKAHYCCLLLILHNDTLIPAKAEFNGVKEKAGALAIRAVEAAATTEWLEQSDTHRITAVVNTPTGRVVHTLTTSVYTSKSTGYRCHPANVMSTPASVAEMKLFLEYLSDEDSRNELMEARGVYDERNRFLTSLVNAQTNPQGNGQQGNIPAGTGPTVG